MKYFGILVFSFLFVTLNVFSQSSDLSQSDLRKLKVDELSDQQIQQIISRADESGMTQQQLEYMVLSKGLPASELQKLKTRMAQINAGSRTDESQVNAGRADNKDVSTRNMESINAIFSEGSGGIKQKIFGYSLFNTKNLTFEPSLNIATPEGYLIGPGDEIIIDIWGASQQNYTLEVNPEGYIFISNLGPVYLNGLTIEKARIKIKSRLTSIYAGLSGSNPNTWVTISIGNMRTIQVTVTGEVNLPGTYSLPSVASAYNALYLAGGPGINGSFRAVSVIREGNVIATLDLYDFLVNGKSVSTYLRDQDVIHVPVYKNRVEVTGEIVRPAMYEVLDDESVDDFLQIAGGFTPKAYEHRIKLYRKTSRDFLVLDIEQPMFENTMLANGDLLVIDPILDRYQNRVEIAGAVYREGIYALSEGLSLKQLIERAEGLREDAFTNRGYIYRLGKDLKTQSLSFDPIAVLNGSAEDILLQREDYIKIPSVLDLQEELNVQIAGEVQHPGQYPYQQELKLGELILEAGGFSQAASLANVEIARRIYNPNAEEAGTMIAEVFQFTINEQLTLNDDAANFVLQPFDQVFIRRSPGYEMQKKISIEGELAFPGSYVLTSKNDRISDMIQRAGGFTPEAYLQGARLVRRVTMDEQERQRALQAIMQESEDSGEISISTEKEQPIGIELEKIMSNPGSDIDLLLNEGDRLIIPKQLQTVRLNGAVLYPVTVRYERGRSLRHYIARSGGFAENAKKGKAYVIYANGSLDKTRNLLFFRDYPKVEPGSEIVIPTKPEREGMSTQEWVGLTSVLSSTALVMITIINNLK